MALVRTEVALVRTEVVPKSAEKCRKVPKSAASMPTETLRNDKKVCNKTALRMQQDRTSYALCMRNLCELRANSSEFKRNS